MASHHGCNHTMFLQQPTQRMAGPSKRCHSNLQITTAKSPVNGSRCASLKLWATQHFYRLKDFLKTIHISMHFSEHCLKHAIDLTNIYWLTNMYKALRKRLMQKCRLVNDCMLCGRCDCAQKGLTCNLVESILAKYMISRFKHNSDEQLFLKRCIFYSTNLLWRFSNIVKCFFIPLNW